MKIFQLSMTMSRYITEFIPTFLSLRAQHIQRNLKQMHKTLLKSGGKKIEIKILKLIYSTCMFTVVFKTFTNAQKKCICQIKLDIIHARSLFDMTYWTIQWLHFRK